MTETQFFNDFWPYIGELWPAWEVTNAERDAWKRACAGHSVHAAKLAAQDLYQEKSDAYKPPMKAFLGRCRELREHAPIDQNRADWLQWLYRQPKLYQARVAAYSRREMERRGATINNNAMAAQETLDDEVKRLETRWRLWHDERENQYHQVPKEWTDQECESWLNRIKSTPRGGIAKLFTQTATRLSAPTAEKPPASIIAGAPAASA